MNLRYLHRIAIWAAAFSVATAIANIVAYVFAANPRSPLLTAAEVAAAIAVASVLVSAIVDYLLARRLPWIDLPPWAAAGKPPARDCSGCLQKRREVLNERLNIDDPRLCS